MLFRPNLTKWGFEFRQFKLKVFSYSDIFIVTIEQSRINQRLRGMVGPNTAWFKCGALKWTQGVHWLAFTLCNFFHVFFGVNWSLRESCARLKHPDSSRRSWRSKRNKGKKKKKPKSKAINKSPPPTSSDH